MTASPVSAVHMTVTARKLFDSDFYLALETLRSEAGGPADTGHRFERLMRRAFETHHEYGPERFERVWLWLEWPERKALGYGIDIGVDLVAKQTPAYGGGLCAIQCKNFAEHRKVPTSEINSFLATSGSEDFASRILVVTSDLEKAGWTKVQKASPRCEVIGPAVLDSWDAPWQEFLDRPDEFAFDRTKRHKPRSDQRDALDAVGKGYRQGSRGRLVMPCGTGKSLVAMWAAEENAGAGATVLYLVPSIALMGQTMREWARNRSTGHIYVGVCSDKTTGRRTGDGDTARDLAELSMPVTTDRDGIAQALAQPAGDKMRVVFSTYQSLPVLASALPEDFAFDLVVCDEAHRTTGVDRPTDDEVSAFRLIHDDKAVPAQFRLFMTATQRIYTAAAKVRAATKDSDIYSMDDEDTYGPLLYEMSFKDAVDAGLLSDYEVLVVATSQSRLTTGMSNLVAAVNREGGKRQIVSKEDAVKLLGCWDALADPNTTGVVEDRPTGKLASGSDRGHLNTAIAFTNTVNLSKAIAGPSGESRGLWQGVAAEASTEADMTELLDMSVEHVDGSTPAITRAARLDRLRDDPQPGICKVISNARVLTEGVDVPALDAVVFLQPRKSKIDIVQAVGRVMRTYPGKETGYIVIPVVVPEGKGVTDIEVLDSSDFGIVWDVVRALRSHDERMDMWVNHIDAASKSGRVKLITRETDQPLDDEDVEQLRFVLDERVASKMVERCGDRKMWPSWGARAAGVCREVRKKVDAQLVAEDTAEAFEEFVDALRSAVGGHLTEDQAAEMVAQHVVTIPIFDCLFADSQFANANPVSVAINNLLSSFAPVGGTAASAAGTGAALAMELFEEELRPLTRAYRTMRTVFEGALTAAAKVDVLREVYDGFFQAAMKDVVKRLGIVYTPVEIVDFIIRSADAVCRKEFEVGITSENVNVLDPFTGTGTFIYRLLTAQDVNGDHIIRIGDLRRKYYSELYANELVLLAYYIAAIKIEAGMAERGGFPPGAFEAFPGITFGDTFLAAGGGAQLPGMADNTARQSRQGGVPITVIAANPPWSAGQKSSGDDNPNISYPHIEQRGRDTYGKRHRDVTGRGAGHASGNLYVESFRWASDRLDIPPGDRLRRGVIAMVHPNSLSTAPSFIGMRAALRDEFSDIYVVNLLGDAAKSGEERQREGQSVFRQGSRNGVQITVAVRNPKKDLSQPAELHYATAPDYSSTEEKFAWLAQLGDVTSDQLELVPVNDNHDWVNLTDGSFDDLLPVCVVGPSKQRRETAVLDHALGAITNCDTYVYSFGYDDLVLKINNLIDAYDGALAQVQSTPDKSREATIERLTENTPESLRAIKWTHTLKKSLKNGEEIEFDESRIREVQYRPFTKLWLYEDHRILSQAKATSNRFPRQDAAAGGGGVSLSCCQAFLGGLGQGLGWLVGGLGFEHGQDDVAAASGDADHGGVVAFAFGSFALVVGAGVGVVLGGDEGRGEEGVLESVVAASGFAGRRAAA